MIFYFAFFPQTHISITDSKFILQTIKIGNRRVSKSILRVDKAETKFQGSFYLQLEHCYVDCKATHTEQTTECQGSYIA